MKGEGERFEGNKNRKNEKSKVQTKRVRERK
jgi:hypothetical protein